MPRFNVGNAFYFLMFRSFVAAVVVRVLLISTVFVIAFAS
jgi:hypothetical protein